MSQIGQRLADLRSKIKKELAPESAIVADFVLTLLHSGTAAHLLHLQTRSGAHHLALRDYYQRSAELIDSFAESYQGRYGVISGYHTEFMPPSSEINFIDGIAEYVDSIRADLPKNSICKTLLMRLQLLLTQQEINLKT